MFLSDVACVSLLLMQFNGPKALHLAAINGNLDAIRVLITECGCKADLRDEVRTSMCKCVEFLEVAAYISCIVLCRPRP